MGHLVVGHVNGKQLRLFDPSWRITDDVLTASPAPKAISLHHEFGLNDCANQPQSDELEIDKHPRNTSIQQECASKSSHSVQDEESQGCPQDDFYEGQRIHVFLGRRMRMR